MGKKSKRRSRTTKIKPHHDSVVVVDSTDPYNLSLPTMIAASIRRAAIETSRQNKTMESDTTNNVDKETYEILKVLEKVCGGSAVYISRGDMDSLMASIQTNPPILEEVHSLRETLLFIFCYKMIRSMDFYKDRTYRKFNLPNPNRPVHNNATTNSDQNHGGFRVTVGDKKFLRTIILNKHNKESLFAVAHATMAMASIENFAEQRQSEGLHLYQECVKLCKQISDEEKQQPLPSPWPMSADNNEDIGTVGDYVDFVSTVVQDQLDGIQQWVKAVFGNNVGKGMLPGGICDGCGVPHEEGTAPFQVCSRCKKSYYCCKACQLEDWKHHKKNHCRKPGEFCIGDKVLAAGEGIFLSEPGIILSQAENTQEGETAWLVAFPCHGEKKAIVPSTKLRVMQSSELRFQKALNDISGLDYDRIKMRLQESGLPVVEIP